MTTGRILLDLADLQKQTMHILGRTSTAVRQFDILAETIRRENYQRLRSITQGAEAVNGTYWPEGTVDYNEYTQAHAASPDDHARRIKAETLRATAKELENLRDHIQTEIGPDDARDDIRRICLNRAKDLREEADRLEKEAPNATR